MNESPKVVFSNSLTSAEWGETTIATGDMVDAVARQTQERFGGSGAGREPVERRTQV